MPYTPPVAASGGFMILSVTNGTDTHKMKAHVLAFDPTQYNTAGAIGGTDTDGHHNYAYAPEVRPAGSEFGINDTFAAYAAIIKAAWNNSWTISLAALYRTVAGVSTLVPVTPTPTPVVGTSPNGAATGQARAAETTLSFRTAFGGKLRVCLIGANYCAPNQLPAIVTSSTGATAVEQAIVGYLSGANTAIVGHDNGKAASVAHAAFAINRRLRRHYGYA